MAMPTGAQTSGAGPTSFWKSAGLHLLERNAHGWLTVTPQFILAYLTRPEVHPIDTSCAREIALHEALLDNPFRVVPDDELNALADPDAADNYRVVLAFRDQLVAAGTVEGAYLVLMRSSEARTPPVFISQLTHVIARNMLDGTVDPIRVRAAEILFRDQSVSVADKRLMFADEEIVSMHAQTGETGLAQLLSETGTPMREITLDVLDDDNAQTYWARSDRFDTVLDMRFEQPGVDAFARVLETWLKHLLGVGARIEPRPRLDDRDWRWHIGLDAEATVLLNALYEGKPLGEADLSRIVGLFRMTLDDNDPVIDAVKGRPIYLGLAMDPASIVRMKPQNLLMNLPFGPAA
ncbi:MAG: DUF6352 family protein [Pseudomonadota bacterium]